MNILIVDDNKEFREAFAYIIQENFANKYNQIFEG